MTGQRTWTTTASLLVLIWTGAPACSDDSGKTGGSGSGGTGAAGGAGGGTTGGAGGSGGGTGGSGGSANDCCENKISGGCSDSSIQQCVCDQDPVCCDEAWDDVCIDLAKTSCSLTCGGGSGGAGGSGGSSGAGAASGTGGSSTMMTCAAAETFFCGKANARDVHCSKVELCFDPGLQSIAGVSCAPVPQQSQCTDCMAYLPSAPQCPPGDSPMVSGTVNEGCRVFCGK